MLLQLPLPTAPTLPAPFPSTREQRFAAHLPPVQRIAAAEPAAEREADPRLRIAHAALVSAACYLSTAPAADNAAALEAVQLLYDLSQEVLGSMDVPKVRQGELEDRVWQGKQRQWERQRSVEAAVRYVKAGADLPKITPPQRPRSRWARWWSRLRRPSQVHPF